MDKWSDKFIDVLDPENQPGSCRIRTGSGALRLTDDDQKYENKQIPSFEVQRPGSEFCPNRIRNPVHKDTYLMISVPVVLILDFHST